MEMIAVMAVIAVATAAILPAVTSVGKASSRRAAVSLTLGALDQARALALASSGNYYVAFATNHSSWPEDYRCRAFAIFEEVFNPEGAVGSQYVCLPVGEWTKLPVGSAYNPSATTVFQQDPGVPAKMFYCRALGGDREAAYFKFNGIGGVEEPSDPARAYLRIFEGFLEASGQLTYTNKDSDQWIKVSLATGRAKVDEDKEEL
jgi:type II secretory pathway pseudopilin PulG